MTTTTAAQSSNGTAPAPLDMTLEIADGDTVHVVRFGDFNALDARAFRLELDLSLLDAFSLALGGVRDLDVLAGLIWLQERKDQPELTYQAVAERFTYERFLSGARRRQEQNRTRLDSTEDGDGEGVDGDPSR